MARVPSRQSRSACWVSKLKLPAVATWWCGEPPALEYVLSHLDELVIKPAYPNQHFEPVFGRDLTAATRPALIARLRSRPYAYVAQEHLALSQAPVWRQNGSLGLSAKALSIRVYARRHRARLSRHARRAGSRRHRRRRRRRFDSARRRQQGHLGARWRACGRSGASPSMPRRRCCGRTTFPRAPSRTSSGWGATPFGAKTSRGSFRSTLAVRVDASEWRTAVKFCRDLGLRRRDARSVGKPARRSQSARRRRGCEADGVVRLAGAQQAVGQLLARGAGSAAAVAARGDRARRAARSARPARPVALRARRFRVRRHDARRRLAPDAHRPPPGAAAVSVGICSRSTWKRRSPRVRAASSGCSKRATASSSIARATSPRRASGRRSICSFGTSSIRVRSRFSARPSGGIWRRLAASLGGQAVEGLGNAVPYLDDAALFALEADTRRCSGGA